MRLRPGVGEDALRFFQCEALVGCLIGEFFGCFHQWFGGGLAGIYPGPRSSSRVTRSM